MPAHCQHSTLAASAWHVLLLRSLVLLCLHDTGTPGQLRSHSRPEVPGDVDNNAALIGEYLASMRSIGNDTGAESGHVAVAIRVAELLQAASRAKISTAGLAELRELGAEVIRGASRPQHHTQLRTEYTSLGGQELHRAPLVHQFDGFFSAQEAEHIVSLARPRLRASTARDAHGTERAIAGRTSQTAGVDPWEDPIVANLTARVAGIVGLSVENLEVLSVTRYTGQQHYKTHVDSFGLKTRQDRLVTALLYLNDVPQGAGGGTRFPRLPEPRSGKPLEVAPANGRMLIFHNLKQTLETELETAHAGLPMHRVVTDVPAAEELEQEKWIANCWFRGEKWQEPANYWPAHWLAALPCAPHCTDDEHPQWAGNTTAHLLAKAHQDRVQWRQLWSPKHVVQRLEHTNAYAHGSLTMTSGEL